MNADALAAAMEVIRVAESKPSDGGTTRNLRTAIAAMRAAIRAETPATRTDAVTVISRDRPHDHDIDKCHDCYALTRRATRTDALDAPPLPELGCGCGACRYLRRKQDEHYRARLATPPEAQAVPEGWPMVDGEPFNPVVKWTPPEAQAEAVLPKLALNDENGPWCGCGNRLGHPVRNVDCTPEDYEFAPVPERAP